MIIERASEAISGSFWSASRRMPIPTVLPQRWISWAEFENNHPWWLQSVSAARNKWHPCWSHQLQNISSSSRWKGLVGVRAIFFAFWILVKNSLFVVGDYSLVKTISFLRLKKHFKCRFTKSLCFNWWGAQCP